MTYQYTYRTTASELWQLSMYYIYGSMVGLCNLIFTGAIIALIVAYWQTALIWQRALLIAALSVFTVLQPLVIYRRARRQAARITEDTTLSADASGIHIRVGRIAKKPTMIILYTDAAHGYVLSNRVLGGEREAFYNYAVSRAEKGRTEGKS